MHFDIFIPTLERSTFDYCLKSIENQKNIKLHDNNLIIIKNHNLCNALNIAVEKTNKKFLLKVDDDFLIHSCFLSYLDYFIKNNINIINNAGMIFWHLWEDFSNRKIQSIKLYNISVINKVGPFIANNIGKVDVNFINNLKKHRYKFLSENSIVALHSCGSWEEQVKYEKEWSKNSILEHRKKYRNFMKTYEKCIEEQYFEKDVLIERNNTNKDNFIKWINHDSSNG